MQNYTGVASSGGSTPIAGSLVSPAGVSVVDFAIPAGVRRLTLLFSGIVATAGSLVRLGTSAGLLISGYYSVNLYSGSGAGVEGFSTDGLRVPKAPSADPSFYMLFYRASPNRWSTTSLSPDGTGAAQLTTSSVPLPGQLTTLRYISVSTITSGSIELLWEF